MSERLIDLGEGGETGVEKRKTATCNTQGLHFTVRLTCVATIAANIKIHTTEYLNT